MAERYVLLGLAGPRSEWFGRVSRWATEAVVPADFVKTMSAEELRARLDTGRPFSAALLDATVATLDRDLLATLRSAGCLPIVILDPRVDRDWPSLGAATVLEPDFDRSALIRALAAHARPIHRTEARAGKNTDPLDEPRWQCPVVTVTGAPGAGRSILAAAVAQGLAGVSRHQPVALADLALDADLAAVLDAGDVVPGVQELVESHRLGAPTVDAIRHLLFPIESGGYDLLAGLREPSDWPVLRRGSVGAALAGLRQSYRMIVVDTDADISGEHETGSRDLEDRNAMARSAIGAATVLMVVGRGTVQGLHRHLRITRRLLRSVEPAQAVVPVINHAPRPGPGRAEMRHTFALLAETLDRRIAAPVFVPHSRHLERRVLDGAAIPRQLVDPLAAAAGRHLDEPATGTETASGRPITPGELGQWSDDEEAA